MDRWAKVYTFIFYLKFLTNTFQAWIHLKKMMSVIKFILDSFTYSFSFKFF